VPNYMPKQQSTRMDKMKEACRANAYRKHNKTTRVMQTCKAWYVEQQQYQDH
jgi:hypothetical protein